MFCEAEVIFFQVFEISKCIYKSVYLSGFWFYPRHERKQKTHFSLFGAWESWEKGRFVENSCCQFPSPHIQCILSVEDKNVLEHWLEVNAKCGQLLNRKSSKRGARRNLCQLPGRRLPQLPEPYLLLSLFLIRNLCQRPRAGTYEVIQHWKGNWEYRRLKGVTGEKSRNCTMKQLLGEGGKMEER